MPKLVYKLCKSCHHIRNPGTIFCPSCSHRDAYDVLDVKQSDEPPPSPNDGSVILTAQETVLVLLYLCIVRDTTKSRSEYEAVKKLIEEIEKASNS